MSTNREVAEILLSIADLLDLKNERFKPQAYRRAARSIEGLTEDLRQIASRGTLGTIPGVGEAIQKKIEEYLADGQVTYYEQLRHEFPPGVLALMQMPGIGPKTTARFFRELNVQSPAELATAIAEGKLERLDGFKERKIQKIRDALALAPGSVVRRTPLREAWRLARSLVDALAAKTPVQNIEVAGSLRRRRESVADIDILATSADPPATIDVFAQLPGTREVVMHGDTKATVVHEPGIQVDLRVVDPRSFGAALQYFTGSKDHNIRIRSLARDRGLKINEYGVFRGEDRLAGATEQEVYDSLGLPWIPPEIREERGEVDAALAGKVPALIDIDQIQGELHRHVPEDLDAARLETLRAEALRRKLRYLGLVVDGSESRIDATRRAKAIRSLWSEGAPDPLKLYVGIELPANALSAPVPGPSEFDYWIVSSRNSREAPLPPPLGQAGANAPLFVGHLRFASEGIEVPMEVVRPWLEWGHEYGVALEVTPDGASDGLDSTSIRRAVEIGNSLVLGAGDSGFSDLNDLELSAGLARRGWAPPSAVVNAQADPGLGSDRGVPAARRRKRGPR